VCSSDLAVVTISITIAAYEAVKATLPDDADAFPPERDERGGVRFIVDRHTLDRLTALRGSGALFALGANQSSSSGPHGASRRFFRRPAMLSLKFAPVAAFVLALSPALAQNAPVASARTTVETVSADGASLGVKTRAGEELTIHVGPKTRFALVVPATLADVKPGSFVGVAAMPGDGGQLKAMEVHIFPDAMRGTGEGHRPFDLGPGSSMTNGNITARVDATSGPMLTVTYKGGQQAIVVDPKTPIVALAPGAQTDLKPGAAIIARGARQDDGTIDAAFILVGKDGLVPPM
jgi:hypothetical protein